MKVLTLMLDLNDERQFTMDAKVEVGDGALTIKSLFYITLQERCILDGTLTVNYDQVDIDYHLHHNDLLANIVHR